MFLMKDPAAVEEAVGVGVGVRALVVEWNVGF
jgi:hypothetical protein